MSFNQFPVETESSQRHGRSLSFGTTTAGSALARPLPLEDTMADCMYRNGIIRPSAMFGFKDPFLCSSIPEENVFPPMTFKVPKKEEEWRQDSDLWPSDHLIVRFYCYFVEFWIVFQFCVYLL
jgi:hypothetical protein